MPVSSSQTPAYQFTIVHIMWIRWCNGVASMFETFIRTRTWLFKSKSCFCRRPESCKEGWTPLEGLFSALFPLSAGKVLWGMGWEQQIQVNGLYLNLAEGQNSSFSSILHSAHECNRVRKMFNCSSYYLYRTKRWSRRSHGFSLAPVHNRPLEQTFFIND